MSRRHRSTSRGRRQPPRSNTRADAERFPRPRSIAHRAAVRDCASAARRRGPRSRRPWHRPPVVPALPSADSYAVIVLPLRESFTHRGAVEALPAVFVLVPPLAVLRWNATPFPAETSMKACAEDALSEPRTITPALAHAAVY